MGFFSMSNFMPHGHCYLWKPELIGSIVGSDLLIGISYFLISVCLVYLVRRARLPFSKTFIAFGCFIGACGAGHFVDIITVWYPAYWLTAGVRIVTAIASVMTAVSIFLLIPRVIETVRELSNSKKRGQMLHLLVQGVKDYAIFMLDPQGLVVSWNEGAARISGHSENEIIGKHYSTFYPPEDVKNGLPENAMRRALVEGRFEGEGWRTRKDGSRFCASFVLTAIKDSDGNLQGFAKVIRDVTAKQQAENELKVAYEELERRVRERTEQLHYSNEQLQASQQKFQELVNTVDGIVWEAEVGKPKFTFVSRQAERVLGYPIERWLGEEGFWRGILHPEDHARLTGDKYRSVTEKRDSQIEYRVVTADGRVIWVKDYIKIIYDFGTPTKMRGIMVDITERKTVEENLRTAQAQALKASSVKSEFLATMSHEIRTPLNAIIGMATIALDGKMDPEQKDCLMTIKTAADSLLNLINEILDFSKVEAGKVSLEISDFELMAICTNAVDVIAPIAKEKEIEIDVRPSPDLPTTVRGDPGRLLQILLNLLGNAVKFTPNRGKVSLVIQHLAAERLRFEVSDTGPGIEEKIKEKLFQPFSQADSSTARKFGGTGLGLSICKQLVVLMTGQIGLESKPGQGSMFWFEIPLPTSSVAARDYLPTEKRRKDDSDSEADAKGFRTSQLPPARILVAEDNPANRKVILRFLEKLGHHADVVADGKEALATSQLRSFDLIFMDCQMPEMDGYEATRKIRELERVTGHPRIPIVALTAHAFSGDEKKCREAGMDDYLTKPIGLKQLEETISSWLLAKANTAPISVDLNYLKSLDELQSDGMPDIVCELIDLFKDDGPQQLRSMDSGIQSRDFDTLRRSAHHFKSTCHNVGAKKLAALCNQIESIASGSEAAKEITTLVELLSEASQEFDRVSTQLRDLAAARTGTRNPVA